MIKILFFRIIVKIMKYIVKRDDSYLFLHKIGLEDIIIISELSEKKTDTFIIGRNEIALIISK